MKKWREGGHVRHSVVFFGIDGIEERSERSGHFWSWRLGVEVITACEKGGVWELAVRILAASSQFKVHNVNPSIQPGDRSQFPSTATLDGSDQQSFLCQNFHLRSFS